MLEPGIFNIFGKFLYAMGARRDMLLADTKKDDKLLRQAGVKLGPPKRDKNWRDTIYTGDDGVVHWRIISMSGNDPK